MTGSNADENAGVNRGVRLGVDVGAVRVGLAASDPDGLVATPVATLQRAPQPPATDGAQTLATDLAQIVAEAAERDAAVVYVGLPRQLSGKEGAATAAAREYAGQIAVAVAPVEVRLVDERMTTVTAHQALHAAGRSSRHHRAVVDQVAAVVILQTAIDTERGQGCRAGELVPAQGADPTPDLSRVSRTTESMS